MRASLRDEDVRARFLEHYAETGVIAQAARALNLSESAVGRCRRADPEFAAALAACAPVRRRADRPAYRRMTAARRAAFFAAFAETGNATAAARATGVSYGTAWWLKLNDDSFAAAWADARAQALGRVEDGLFDGALNGFTRIETSGDTTRIVRTRSASAMFKLLERAARIGASRYRTVELTPQAFAEAQVKIERHIRLATSARLAEAGLPPPTVPAS